jgi:hypothetical protein
LLGCSSELPASFLFPIGVTMKSSQIGSRTKKEPAITPLLTACKTSRFYYNPGSGFPALQDLLQVSRQAVAKIAPSTCAALRVISSYGMRAGEYLRSTVADVIAYDLVLIRGSKGSASYTILLPGLHNQLCSMKSHPPYRSLSGETYMRLYRACLALNVGRIIRGNTNVSRTHLSRHKLADHVCLNHTERELSDILHHRSITSQSYYGADRRFTNGHLNRRDIR